MDELVRLAENVKHFEQIAAIMEKANKQNSSHATANPQIFFGGATGALRAAWLACAIALTCTAITLINSRADARVREADRRADAAILATSMREITNVQRENDKLRDQITQLESKISVERRSAESLNIRVTKLEKL